MSCAHLRTSKAVIASAILWWFPPTLQSSPTRVCLAEGDAALAAGGSEDAGRAAVSQEVTRVLIGAVREGVGRKTRATAGEDVVGSGRSAAAVSAAARAAGPRGVGRRNRATAMRGTATISAGAGPVHVTVIGGSAAVRASAPKAPAGTANASAQPAVVVRAAAKAPATHGGGGRSRRAVVSAPGSSRGTSGCVGRRGSVRSAS